MTVTHGANLICSSNLALGRVGPSGITLDGQSLIDVAQFVNALNVTVFARGRGPRELSFSVTALFETEADALEFMLTHEDELDAQEDLVIEDDGETISFTMADAASQARAAQIQGTAVRMDYKFTGAKFTVDP